MRKIEPEFITGMGYIGASPGVLYRMGGAGEQTVVTGNPALLEGVKGNRFTSLTLHGKSSQGSTTGANILKDDYLSLCKTNIDLFSANGLFTFNANYEKACEFNLHFSAGSIFADGIKDEATYYIAFRPIGFTPKYNYQLSLKNKIDESNESLSNSVNGIVSSVSGADLKKSGRIQLYFYKVSVSEPVVSGSKFQMIFSKNSDCNYEPYTGGKPSPSPEYPQEIKSAGDVGEINVNVQGANLFDINDSSTIMDNYYVDSYTKKLTFANGNYGRVFKLLPNTSYTWTQEQITDTAQNVITDIQLALFDEIPTNGKIAKERYVNYNSGKTVFKFNTDEKYVYIFVKTGHLNTNKNRCENEKTAILNVGTEPLPYEPYKPDQKLIIPTPNGLPGIPVSSGGNYTDEKGQQWVCDEVDFKKGVYVQRIGKKTITSKDAFFKSGLSTNDVNYFGLNNFFVHIGTRGEKDVLMSNCFVAGIYQNFGALGKIFLGSASGNVTYFSVDAQKYPDTETFKQWAVENGLMFLYQLADIIENPLAAEELYAYKTLRTYSPTTTVINDAGAGMSAGYRRK